MPKLSAEAFIKRGRLIKALISRRKTKMANLPKIALGAWAWDNDGVL